MSACRRRAYCLELVLDLHRGRRPAPELRPLAHRMALTS